MAKLMHDADTKNAIRQDAEEGDARPIPRPSEGWRKSKAVDAPAMLMERTLRYGSGSTRVHCPYVPDETRVSEHEVRSSGGQMCGCKP
jgi:hypothetical protein